MWRTWWVLSLLLDVGCSWQSLNHGLVRPRNAADLGVRQLNLAKHDWQLSMSAQRIILWFRNDLRLLDNPIVSEAAHVRARRVDCEIVPVYCFDPRQFKHSSFGTRKTGAIRAQFIRQSVKNLKDKLTQIGSDLLILHGRPEDVIASHLDNPLQTTVLTQEEVTAEELLVDDNLKCSLQAQGSVLNKIWGATLYHRDDLKTPVSGLQAVFTPWKDEVESSCTIRDCLPYPRAKELGEVPAGLRKLAEDGVPSLEALGFSDEEIRTVEHPDERRVLSFMGGEDAALARVEEYIWREDCLRQYFETRNGMIGPNYSTKFSPWLALGCLSPRYLHHEAKRYEAERVQNKSTYWLTWELTCRDFYRFKCLKYGNAIFKLPGMAHVEKTWRGRGEELERWQAGQTGIPLVDANMRELLLTGFMSNRGRQNVASYLTQDLGVDWRLGAAWFEEHLIDYDVCSNWANWNAAGGVAGGRVNRFNAVKQSAEYDAEGDYCRLWLPELRSLPGSKVHQPWRLSADEQAQYQVRIGAPSPSSESGGTEWYPLPMVPPPVMPDPAAQKKRKEKSK